MTQVKVGFQGDYGSYSHMACQQIYPEQTYCPYKSFADIFEAITNDELKYGVIPMENSYAGRVTEIHNLLREYDISIVSEKFVLIEHSLCAKLGIKLIDVKKVYSHPQALMQCKKYIGTYNFKTVETINTAIAAQMIADLSKHDNQTKTNNFNVSDTNSDDKTDSDNEANSSAAICSKKAAELYGLNILESNIQDIQNNYTIFITIAKAPLEFVEFDYERTITTLLFQARNIPGSVYKSLGGFATNGVNLLKLESYISTITPDRAEFFISIQGHINDDKVVQSLEELGFFSNKVKLLGVYPMDEKRII